MQVRLGTYEIEVKKKNSDQVTFNSPKVSMPGTVHIQVAYNGQ
jgi:hypothetical protein